MGESDELIQNNQVHLLALFDEGLKAALVNAIGIVLKLILAVSTIKV